MIKLWLFIVVMVPFGGELYLVGRTVQDVIGGTPRGQSVGQFVALTLIALIFVTSTLRAVGVKCIVDTGWSLSAEGLRHELAPSLHVLWEDVTSVMETPFSIGVALSKDPNLVLEVDKWLMTSHWDGLSREVSLARSSCFPRRSFAVTVAVWILLNGLMAVFQAGANPCPRWVIAASLFSVLWIRWLEVGAWLCVWISMARISEILCCRWNELPTHYESAALVILVVASIAVAAIGERRMKSRLSSPRKIAAVLSSGGVM